MEPVSLAVGVAGLAGVFSTCIECFELFESAKSFQEDFDDLILLLDCQKERLMTWGELVGMLQAGEADGHSDSLVARCFSRIISLLTNVEQLQGSYGVRPSSPLESRGNLMKRIGSERLRRLRDAFGRLDSTDTKALKETGPLLKTKWAIHDKAKFGTLLSTVEKFVTELHRLIPVEKRSQTKMVHSDIALLEMSELRSVERVCEKQYPSWADAASAIVMATEAGTTIANPQGERQGHIAPNLSLYANMVVMKETRAVFTPKTRVRLGLEPPAGNQRYYFIFTDNCFNQHVDSQCHIANFGDTCLQTQGPESVMSFNSASLDVTPNASKRIVDSMKIKFTNDQLEILRLSDTKDSYRSMVLQTMLPLATFYVYCGPCVFAFRTALYFCNEQKDSAYLKCLVRIDDRINTSCCLDSSKASRFASFLETIKEIETGKGSGRGFLRTWLRYIDRVWLEQRLYKLEDEIEAGDLAHADPADAAKELFQELSADSNYNGFVILGETVHCGWMLQAEPFPWTSRMPRDTEIFQIHHGYSSPRGRIWQRTYLGTYTPREYSTLKKKAVAALANGGGADMGCVEETEEAKPNGLGGGAAGGRRDSTTSNKRPAISTTGSTLVAQNAAAGTARSRSPSENGEKQ